jgi:hypothetical protein
MSVKANEVPTNDEDEVQAIGEGWADGDVPNVQFDSLLTIPVLITQIERNESKQDDGGFWYTFTGKLLAASKRGLEIKSSGEIIDAEIGTEFSSASGARRVKNVLQRMLDAGVKGGYVVIPSKVEGDTSGKARMLRAVEAEEAKKLADKLPKPGSEGDGE